MPSQPQPDDDKLRELILHIAKRSERDICFGATKLNKLLFFADFIAYLRLGKAMTGQEDQKLDNGPVPRRLKPLLKDMERGKAIAIQRVDFHGGNSRGPSRSAIPAMGNSQRKSFSSSTI